MLNWVEIDAEALAANLEQFERRLGPGRLGAVVKANAYGHGMLEVAALARPMVVGPHTGNFADTVKQLDAGDAIRILSGDLADGEVAGRLAEGVRALLDDPTAASDMGRRGRDVVKANLGATDRTLDKLTEILDCAQHRAS